MRINFLKNLFKKKDFDWDSKDHLEKNLKLLQETKTFNLYQDDRDAKNLLEEELNNLLDD